VIGRRKFFGLLASTPLAAKGMLDQATADGAGVVTNGLGGFSASISSPSDGYEEEAKVASKKASWFLRSFGVPEHHRRRLWEETRYPYRLDSDIACKRSWSMCVKIATQRQRDYERRLHEAQFRLDFDQLNEEFSNKWGFRWWF